MEYFKPVNLGKYNTHFQRASKTRHEVASLNPNAIIQLKIICGG